MLILVTGGGGFIGSNLIDRLLTDGHDVRVLDNFSTGRRPNLDHVRNDIDLVEGDLRSYERVHHAVKGCDYVLHQGALPSVPRSVQDPLTSNEINVGGTLNVLLAARDAGVRRVVMASSSSVYGDSPGDAREESQATTPIAPYAVSKLAAEQYCRAFHRVYGIETVALRYFNVYGPRQDPGSEYSAVIPKFITLMMAGRQPSIFGDGEQSRDFTHVSDVVEANMLAMQAPDAGGNVLNVACGDTHSLNKLVRVLNELLGTSLESIHLPPRAGDIPRSLADITRAQQVLGYIPKVTFEDGLARSVSAFEAAVV